jgi:3-hydroxyisobutyrate dehydrogenase-like beta-hydroxyacid dehydrogenase
MRQDGGMRIGLLHPGEMGAAVGARLREAGHEVGWVSEGRGRATRERAAAGGLTDVSTVAGLTRTSDVILSVCPPHVAVEVASEIAGAGFTGVYVDANAIAPDTARRVAGTVTPPGATFVDAGIVGPPPTEPGSTRLYLSGPQARAVADLFTHPAVDAVVVDDRIGSASAVKMAYAAWTKGTHALLLAIDAVAEREGVADTLRAEWARSLPDLESRLDRARSAAERKGWRWVGEMEQIAETFGTAGAPAGFHAAAADVYRRYPRP